MRREIQEKTFLVPVKKEKISKVQYSKLFLFSSYSHFFLKKLGCLISKRKTLQDQYPHQNKKSN